jgi:hypothetical protein
MYRITRRIDSSIQVLPLSSDLHVSLVDAVGGAAHLQVLPDPLVDLGGVTLYQSPHSRMIHGDAALTHHLFDIAIG